MDKLIFIDEKDSYKGNQMSLFVFQANIHIWIQFKNQIGAIMMRS